MQGSIFLKPRKFRDHAGKNPVHLPCILETVGGFSLRFKKALQPTKSPKKNQFPYENLKKVPATYFEIFQQEFIALVKTHVTFNFIGLVNRLHSDPNFLEYNRQ